MWQVARFISPVVAVDRGHAWLGLCTIFWITIQTELMWFYFDLYCIIDEDKVFVG